MKQHGPLIIRGLMSQNLVEAQVSNFSSYCWYLTPSLAAQKETFELPKDQPDQHD
jgi:hypothetical protein